jgi:hypothetical protein
MIVQTVYDIILQFHIEKANFTEKEGRKATGLTTKQYMAAGLPKRAIVIFIHEAISLGVAFFIADLIGCIFLCENGGKCSFAFRKCNEIVTIESLIP